MIQWFPSISPSVWCAANELRRWENLLIKITSCLLTKKSGRVFNWQCEICHASWRSAVSATGLVAAGGFWRCVSVGGWTHSRAPAIKYAECKQRHTLAALTIGLSGSRAQTAQKKWSAPARRSLILKTSRRVNIYCFVSNAAHICAATAARLANSMLSLQLRIEVTKK